MSRLLAALTLLCVAASTLAVAQPAPACCKVPSTNTSFDTTKLGIIEVTGAYGNVAPGNAFSIALWVQLRAGQPTTAFILSKQKPYWSDNAYDVAAFQVSWDSVNQRLAIDVTTATGKVLTGTIDQTNYIVNLESVVWRLVTVVIDASAGQVSGYIDLAQVVSSPFPALKTDGINSTGSLMIGGQDFGFGNMDGLIGDVLFFNRALAIADIKTIFNYKQCPQAGFNASLPGGCAAPLSGVTKQIVMNPAMPDFASGGNFVQSAPIQWFQTAYPVVPTPAPATSNCVATITATIPVPTALPASGNTWILQVTPTFEAGKGPFTATSLSIYTGPSATASNLIFQTPTMTAGTPVQFYVTFTAATVQLTFVTGQVNICLGQFMSVGSAPTAVIETPWTPGNGAGSPVIFAGTPTYATVLSLTSADPTTYALVPADSQLSACSGATILNAQLNSGDGGQFYTILLNMSSAGLSQAGTLYQVCVFPRGGNTVPVYFAPSIMGFTSGTFLIAPLPQFAAQPLDGYWISNLLHLGALFTDSIPNARISPDYFASLGGEANIQPVPGNYYNVSSLPSALFWTPMTATDSIWGENTATPVWVQYYALAIYSPTNQSFQLAYRYDYAFRLWIDGYQWVKTSSPQGGNVLTTSVITLSQGWHQIIMKQSRVLEESYMQVRVLQGAGLSWAFSIPAGAGANGGSYTDSCGMPTSTPCIPGQNTSQMECFNIGCCWMSNRCYLPSGSSGPTWRADGRCGINFPAPGAQLAQCDQQSIAIATCCSNHGYCGNGTTYCDCPSCVNYRFETSARCNYAKQCSNCQCGAASIAEGNITFAQCRRRCDFGAGCAAFATSLSLSSSSVVAPCTTYLSATGSVCENPVAGSVNVYRKFCQGCAFTALYNQTCTSGWDTEVMFGTGVSLAECQKQCSYSPVCAGFFWDSSNSQCTFLSGPCTSQMQIVARNTVYSMYRCPGDNTTLPQPAPPTNAYNESRSSLAGCYSDPFGELFDTPTGFNYFVQSANSVNLCQQTCVARGALFFLLFNGTVCQCGLRFPQALVKPVALSSSNCNIRCPGNFSQLCGGKSYSLIYMVSPFQGVCQPGWYQFAGSCYQWQPNATNAITALYNCINMGATMSTSPSFAINQFVLALPYALFPNPAALTYRVWAGGAVDSTNVHVEWVDGSAVQYVDWRPNEPSYDSTEPCLEMFSNYPSAYKGSWNNVQCGQNFSYICKKGIPGLPILQPDVEVAQIGGANTYACSTSGQGKAIVGAMYARWRMNAQPVSGQLMDMSPMARYNLQVKCAPGFTSSTCSTTNLKFYTPPVTTGQVHAPATAIILAAGQYFQTTVPFNFPQRTASVCMWFYPGSYQYRQVLFTKPFDRSQLSSFDLSQQILEVYYSYGSICIESNYQRRCSYNTYFYELQWYHLCVVVDEAAADLFVNGQLDSSFRFSSQFSFPQSNQPFFIGAPIYNGSVDTRNAGIDSFASAGTMIADFRIYGAAISNADVTYLYRCTAVNPPNNMLHVYQNTAPPLTLFGHGLFPFTQFQVTRSNCGSGLEPGIQALPALLQSSTGYLPISVSQSTSTTWNICLPDASAPTISQFPMSAGVQLNVVSVSALNGLSTLTANPNNFPITYTVTGTNLAAGHVLVASDTRQCTVNAGSYALFSIINGTSAQVTISAPYGIANTLYICWASGAAAAQTGISFFTGVTITMQSTATNVIIARTDGTEFILASYYSTGYTGSSTMIQACNQYSNWTGTPFMMVVTMGTFQDFWVPAYTSVSPCQMLTGDPTQRLYAPTDPRSTNFNGLFMSVPNPPAYMLGGSSQYWPQDGREYLAVWGTKTRTGELVGGCCSNKFGETSEWYRSFSINLVQLSPFARFLAIPYVPRVVYYPYSTYIRGNVVNYMGTAVNGGVQFTLGVLSNSTSGQVSYQQYSLTASSLSYGYSIPMMFSSGTMRCWLGANVTITNGANLTWTMVAMSRLPPGATTSLSNVLMLGQPGKNGNFPTYGFAVGSASSSVNTDFLAAAGGEANQMPAAGDPSTVSTPTPVPAQWYNTPLSTTLSTTFAVYYLAFAFNTYTTEIIQVTFSVRDNLLLYIDGTLVAGLAEKNPSPGTTRQAVTPWLTVGPGWHQVLVKVLCGSDYPYIGMQFAAPGALFAPSIPGGMPEGAQSLQSYEAVPTMLHLGFNLSQGFVGGWSVDYLNTEGVARPQQGQAVASLVWTALNARGYYYYMPATPPGQFYVSYFAFALYLPSSSVSYGFYVDYTNGVRILIDGNIIEERLPAGDDFAPRTYFSFQGSQGWHQVLVKIGSSQYGTTFAFVPTTNGVAVALQAPVQFPTGSQQLRGNFQSLLRLTYDSAPYWTGIPALTANQIFVNTSASPATFGSVTIQNISMNPSGEVFSWNPMTNLQAKFSGRQLGGLFNAYYAIALYSPTVQSATPWIAHNEQVDMWLDGQKVTSVTGVSFPAPEQGQMFQMTQGWHSLIVQQHAMSDMILTPVSSTMNTSSAAHTYCQSNVLRRLQLCPIAAYCPFGKGRPDGTTPIANASANGLIYAPAVNTAGNTVWLQVGNLAATPGASLCSTVTSLPPRANIAIGCCGDYVPPFFSMSLSTPTPIAWAYNPPLPSLPTPVIRLNAQYSAAPLVTITSSVPGATIVYTLDESTPTPSHGNIYSTPFTVRNNTIVIAIAYTKSQVSAVSALPVVPQTQLGIVRSTIVAGEPAMIPLQGVETAMSVIAVQASATTLIVSLTNSFNAAVGVTQSNVNSGLLTVNPDNTVQMPGLLPGAYVLIYYRAFVGMVLPNGDINGAQFPVQLSAIQFQVSPSVVLANQPSTLTVAAGAFGDLAFFPILATPQSCTNSLCASQFGVTTLTNVSTGASQNFTILPYVDVITLDAGGKGTFNFGSNGLLTCMCYASQAYWPIPNSAPWFASNVSVNVVSSSQTITVTVGNVGANASITFVGNFAVTTSTAIQVGLIGGIAAPGRMPTCTVVNATTNYITCLQSVYAGTSGSWIVTLTIGGQPMAIPSTTVVLTPPNPVITGVTGSCATSSSNCVTGTVLTITGYNFDYVTTRNDAVVLRSTNGAVGAPTCTVTSVTAGQIQCSLTAASTVTGNFSLSVVVTSSAAVTVGSGVVTATGSNGALTFGGGANSRGWNSGGGAAPPVGPGTSTFSPNPASPVSSTLVIALGIVAGVLFVALIAVVVVFLKKPARRAAAPEPDVRGTHQTFNVNADSTYEPPAADLQRPIAQDNLYA